MNPLSPHVARVALAWRWQRTLHGGTGRPALLAGGAANWQFPLGVMWTREGELPQTRVGSWLLRPVDSTAVIAGMAIVGDTVTKQGGSRVLDPAGSSMGCPAPQYQTTCRSTGAMT